MYNLFAMIAVLLPRHICGRSRRLVMSAKAEGTAPFGLPEGVAAAPPIYRKRHLTLSVLMQSVLSHCSIREEALA